MNEIVFKALKEKDFIIKNYLFKIVTDLNLTIKDFILLIYLTNMDEPLLDIDTISKNVYLTSEEIMESFSKLVSMNLITVDMIKDKTGTMKEIISLDNLVKQVTSDKIKIEKEKNKENLFEIFEHEFGRSLSPMEYEIINDWLTSGTNEELIIEALREAIYNGAKSLRYVSKIILSWQEKGIKSKSDIITSLKKESEETNSSDLFDYNWLDEE